MPGFAFWLHVNSNSAISNILVQRSFQSITDNMRIRDRHRGRDDQMNLDKYQPARGSCAQIMDFQRTCSVFGNRFTEFFLLSGYRLIGPSGCRRCHGPHASRTTICEAQLPQPSVDR